MARSRQTAQQLARWELQEAAGCAAVPLRWLITRMAPYRWQYPLRSLSTLPVPCHPGCRLLPALGIGGLVRGTQPALDSSMLFAVSSSGGSGDSSTSSSGGSSGIFSTRFFGGAGGSYAGSNSCCSAASSVTASSRPAASSACWGNRSFSSAAGSAASARRLAAAAQQPPPVAAAADAAALEALDQLPLWRFLREQGFTQQAIRQMQRGVRGTRYSEQKVHADLALNFAALRQEGLDTAAIQQLYQKRSKMLHTTQATFTNSLAVPVLS